MASATSWLTTNSGIECEPRAWPTMAIDCPNPSPRMPGIMAGGRLFGGLAEEHDVPHHSGCPVGADVRVLLGADVGDRLGERRHHQGKAPGDPTGVDAGAVDSRTSLGAGRLDADSSRPPGKNQFDGVTTSVPDVRMRRTTPGSAMKGE